MKITVNGDLRHFASSLTLSELLTALELNPQHLVVEHNRLVVQRQAFETTPLKDGDIIELIEFVAGG